MTPDFLDIPIFPLPNMTFFPHTLLPLHIFEERYRTMTADCLAGDKHMGVALLRDGWQRDYFGQPPIFKTFGVGKIVNHERLANGRYNIVIEGLYRVRLIEEHASEPYRVGRVSVLQDQAIDQMRVEVGAVQKELYSQCGKLVRMMPKLRAPIQNAWSSHPHPAAIADMLASSLIIDPYDRQSVLEETDPLRRLKLVSVQLARILHQLGQQKEVEEEVLEED